MLNRSLLSDQYPYHEAEPRKSVLHNGFAASGCYRVISRDAMLCGGARPAAVAMPAAIIGQRDAPRWGRAKVYIEVSGGTPAHKAWFYEYRRARDFRRARIIGRAATAAPNSSSTTVGFSGLSAHPPPPPLLLPPTGQPRRAKARRQYDRDSRCNRAHGRYESGKLSGRNVGVPPDDSSATSGGCGESASPRTCCCAIQRRGISILRARPMIVNSGG